MEKEKKEVPPLEEQKVNKNDQAPLQNNADFELALKLEREKREQAEKELEETRQKARERFEKKKDEPQPQEEPLTRDSVRQILEEERETLRKELREERAKEIAKRLSKSDSEAELIMEVWKNRKLFGTLDEQIEEAIAIATFKRTQAQADELKRALASKDGVKNENLNSQRKPAPADEPNLNPVDKTAISGMVWDNARGAYRKTIAGGKKVFFVSRDLKKRWTEDAPQK